MSVYESRIHLSFLFFNLPQNEPFICLVDKYSVVPAAFLAAALLVCFRQPPSPYLHICFPAIFFVRLRKFRTVHKSKVLRYFWLFQRLFTNKIEHLSTEKPTLFTSKYIGQSFDFARDFRHHSLRLDISLDQIVKFMKAFQLASSCMGS